MTSSVAQVGLSLQRSEEERHGHHALALPGCVAVLRDILVDRLAVDFFVLVVLGCLF